MHELAICELEAQRFDERQAAARKAHFLRNRFRNLHVSCAEIHVVRDERETHANGHRARLAEFAGPEVGRAFRVGLNLNLETFVFATAHVREVAIRFARGRVFVEIDRDGELAPDALAQSSRNGNTIF